MTVNIPSGTGTWTGPTINYTIPAAVTSLIIQGNTTVSCSGTPGTVGYACTANDQTIIIDSFNASGGTLLNVNIGTKSFRMTGLTWQGGTITSGNTKPNGFLTFSGTSTSFRIDHCHFNTLTYAISNGGGGMTIFTNLWGVVDHTVFDLSGQNNGVRDYAGSADFGDANWAAATGFGTNAFMYLENDQFNGGAANDCDAGGKVVIRYSAIVAATTGGDQGLWQTHTMGQGQERSRGCRAMEVYHNYINNPNPSNNLFTDGDGSSGTGLIWNNSVSTGYSFDVGFQIIREAQTGHVQTAPPNGIGYCGVGSPANPFNSAWDGNSISLTGYPCAGQTGRGQGDLWNGQNFPNAGVSGCSGGSCVPFWGHNLSEPWYMWNENIAGGSLATFPIWNSVQIVQNQDAFIPATSFNGTVGTGFGLHSARPSTCTPGPGGSFNTSPTGSYGVAYFATDDNSGNGELYVCTATNVWTAVYQPYTYPHPLTGGGTTFTWTATVVGSGSLSGTNSGSGTYPSGTTIGPVTATAGTGYTFSAWSAVSGSPACSGATNPCASFVLAANSAATATFTVNSYTLTAAINGTGTGTNTGCGAAHNFGASYTCTETAGGGSTFAGWSSTCGGTPSGSTYSGTMPASNCPVTATFNLIPPPPTTNVQVAGNGKFSGTLTLGH